MEFAKKFLMASTGMVILAFIAFRAFAETLPAETKEKEQIFSTKGTLTQIDASAKILRVKIEGGLELTFRVDDSTQIRKGEALKSFADLQGDQPVEMEYVYNEDFEKVARTVIISVEKSQAPATSGKG